MAKHFPKEVERIRRRFAVSNMAEKGEDIEKDELQKPLKVNGRYVDPWGTTNFPSKTDIFRWMFKEKNERGIGGGLKDLYRFKTQASFFYYLLR